MKRGMLVVLGAGVIWAAWLLGGAGVRSGGESESVYGHGHGHAYEHSESAAVVESRSAPRVLAAVSTARVQTAPDHDEHPHPITAEHRYLERERQLIGALNDALDRQDAPALHELVARYAEHDPQDTHALQQGYRHLAECLEHPGPEATQAAQAYYDRERASVLRRYIRRTCLE